MLKSASKLTLEFCASFDCRVLVWARPTICLESHFCNSFIRFIRKKCFAILRKWVGNLFHYKNKVIAGSLKDCYNHCWLTYKLSLSSQWSLKRSSLGDFVCVSFLWLTFLWEQSKTKLMQTKPRMKLCTRFHGPERPSFNLDHLSPIMALSSWLSLWLTACPLRSSLCTVWSLCLLFYSFLFSL